MRHTKQLGATAALAVIVVLLIVVYTAQNSRSTTATNMVTIGTTNIQVEIASTADQHVQGLSGRGSLAPNHGMLFVYEPSRKVGFWMKDMLFSLDMIFATSDGTIVQIEEHISPDTYPRIFPSYVPVKYVLEVSAGYARNHGIAIGQKIVVE